MGNILSFLHCYDCKKRPYSVFGRKINKSQHIVKPISTPLYYINHIPVTPLVALEENIVENTRNITYNNTAPYLITNLSSPLNNHEM